MTWIHYVAIGIYTTSADSEYRKKHPDLGAVIYHMTWIHYVAIGIYTTSADSQYTIFCVSVESVTMNKYKRGKGLHYNHVDTICILYTSSNGKEHVMGIYMDNGGNKQIYHVIA